MADQIKNIFISHIHEDDEGLGKLKTLASSKGMAIRDSSIHTGKFNNATDPDYIKYGLLKPQIEWAGVLVVFVSANTKNSAWVNWEIECAERLEKRIVGVWSRGEKGCELPEALAKHGDAMVGWHGDSIVDAINGKDIWELPDGNPFPAVHLKRHPC